MDTLENLRTFVAVAEAGNFSEAARRQDLSVSVVKKRVDQFEHRVGVALFERSTRGMKLTEQGARQLPVAIKLLEEADEVLGSFAARAREVGGHLRVKVPATLGRLHLMDLLTEFRRRHPALSMEIHAVDRIVNPIQEGFDVAVGVTPGSFGGVQEVALRPMRRRVVAAPDYLRRRGVPKEPRDLAGHDILNYSPTGEYWEFEKDTQRFVIRHRYLLSCNDGTQLLQAARQGDGIACLSDYLINGPLARGELVEVLADYATPTYWIYLQIPEPLANAPRVRALVTHLKEELTGTAPWDLPAPRAPT
ncbi:LysR family transcriptional regulator [Aquicoccus sp. SCR17]|nr:LysR family transcriptional regulator [Carideicomes alvinocaridis]